MNSKSVFWFLSFMLTVGSCFFFAVLSYIFLGIAFQTILFVTLLPLLAGALIYTYNKKFCLVISCLIIAVFFLIEIINLKNINYDHENSFYHQAVREGVDFDTRKIWDVVAEERKKHPYTHPYILPDFFKKDNHYKGKDYATQTGIFPLGGVPLAHTVYCNESGKFAIYPSDRYGFNNDDSVYDKGVGVLLVGDSMIQAGCVQVGEDVGSLLRANGYGAVSLGMANSDALLIYATLREFAAKISPKIVLWIGYEDDLGGIEMEYNHPILRKYADDYKFEQGLVTSPEKVKSFLETYSAKYETRERKALNKARIWNILTLGYFRQIWGVTRAHGEKFDKKIYQKEKEISPISYKQIDIFKTLLKNANQFKADNAFKIIYVLIPGPDIEISKRHLYRKMIEEENILFYDFGEIIEKQKKPLSIRSHPNAGHFSAKGHKLFNEFLISILQENKIENYQ